MDLMEGSEISLIDEVERKIRLTTWFHSFEAFHEACGPMIV